MKLKRCPFCGYKNLGVGDMTVGHGQSEPAVYCKECGAQGPRGGDAFAVNHLEAWNTRTIFRLGKFMMRLVRHT